MTRLLAAAAVLLSSTSAWAAPTQGYVCHVTRIAPAPVYGDEGALSLSVHEGPACTGTWLGTFMARSEGAIAGDTEVQFTGEGLKDLQELATTSLVHGLKVTVHVPESRSNSNSVQALSVNGF